MNRLVAFGCSFTYGDALPDNFDLKGTGPKPSEFAWPAVLGNMLSLEVDNQGRSGASNFEILYNILRYKFDPSDIVVIMWSFPDRDMLFHDSFLVNHQNHTSIGNWDDSPLAKSWAMTHSTSDLAIKSWFYIHHASTYLESENIRYVNVFTSYKNLRRFKPKFLKVNFFNIEPGIVNMWKDYALDNNHPGVKSHTFIANRIKGFIDANRY
jgi:hypothetical protein